MKQGEGERGLAKVIDAAWVLARSIEPARGKVSTAQVLELRAALGLVVAERTKLAAPRSDAGDAGDAKPPAGDAGDAKPPAGDATTDASDDGATAPTDTALRAAATVRDDDDAPDDDAPDGDDDDAIQAVDQLDDAAAAVHARAAVAAIAAGDEASAEGSAGAALARLAADGAPLAAKIRGAKQWPDVASYTRADSRRPALSDLRLARLLGDPALEARARAVLDDPIALQQLELEVLLDPSNEVAKDDLAYMKLR